MAPQDDATKHGVGEPDAEQVQGGEEQGEIGAPAVEGAQDAAAGVSVLDIDDGGVSVIDVGDVGEGKEQA